MMTEQERLVVNCLKEFATALKYEYIEDVVDVSMEKAQVAFSPEGKQELINHIKSL